VPVDVGSSDAGVGGLRFREIVPAGLFFLSAAVLYTYPFVFQLPSFELDLSTTAGQ
jgi:hypothetical protein